MPTLTHGTIGGYCNHKCRCEACATAFRDYQRAYRAQKKARGLCHWCTEPAAPGNRACQRHLDERRELQARYRHYVSSERKKGTVHVTAA